MLVNELKQYAQELFDKGNSQEDIQSLVSKKFKEELILNEDGSKVDIKDFKLELEEKVEEQEDIQITVKKAVEKEVKSNKSQKIVLPRIEYVNRPTKYFPDVKLAEQFAAKCVNAETLKKLGNTKSLTTYMEIATDADGGSLSPTDANGILADLVSKYNSYEEDTLQVPMNNLSTTFIANVSPATAYVIAEHTAGTESKPNIPTKTITAKKIMSLAPVTGELMRFATLANIGDVVISGLAESIARKKQHLIFTADGTADNTDGSVTGLIETIAAVSNNKSIYEFTGDWDSLTVDAISAIVAKTPTYNNEAAQAWYCNKALWGFLEGLSRSAGGTSYLMQVGQKPIPQLWGYPVKFVDSMPSAQGADHELLFGDLSKAVATGSLPNIEISSSPDFYFDQDVVVFRAISEFGVTVYNPGTASAAGGMILVNFSAS